MFEELGEVDLSAIAELVRIKQEEQVLRERLEKMEATKDRVSPVVYSRVRQDYESRQTALDRESSPLKDRARKEYAKIRTLRGKAEQSVEDASLEKEELEFRRDLGEFPDEQFRGRIGECEKRLAECRQQLAEIVQLKDQFVAAFHSEQELEARLPAQAAEAPSADATVVRPPAAPAPVAPAAAPDRDATIIAGSVLSGRSAASSAKATSRPANVSLSPTAPAPALRRRSPESTQLEPRVALGAAIPAAPPNATRSLAMPRVITLVDDKPTQEYALKPGVTSIGRSPKNQIHLPQSEVSRHHANIVFTPEGYRLVDLGADNGLYVNGQRIKEHTLVDGDVIRIGTQKLLYKG